jgi:hypothetical protein
VTVACPLSTFSYQDLFVSFTGFWGSHSVDRTSSLTGRGKVKFSLEQAMKAQRGSRGIALLFL